MTKVNKSAVCVFLADQCDRAVDAVSPSSSDSPQPTVACSGDKSPPSFLLYTAADDLTSDKHTGNTEQLNDKLKTCILSRDVW